VKNSNTKAQINAANLDPDGFRQSGPVRWPDGKASGGKS